MVGIFVDCTALAYDNCIFWNHLDGDVVALSSALIGWKVIRS
jgi:hypothetical protein